jgi:hypothetical protein
MAGDFLIYYTPFWYTYYSRLRNWKKLFSWIIIYIIPVLYFSVYLQSCRTLREFIVSCIYITLIYNNYEVGYIFNDTETIKREFSPTIRLTNYLFNYYEENKIKIYCCRIILSIFLSLTIYFIIDSLRSAFFAICVAMALFPIYFVYNSIRNLGNLYLHIVLVIIRYCACQFLFFAKLNKIIFLLSIVVFPMINFIERAAEDRFFQKWAQYCVLIPGSFKFRVYYYIIVLLLLLPFFISSIISWEVLIIFFYYLIYRIMLYLFFSLRKK